MQELQKLDEKTSRVLRKEQVITGVVDVVRELVENAIDAEAKRIQISLDNYGMKKIEVKDDGHGIPTFSLKYVVGGGYTSKAAKTENLSCDEYYGFRGEALSGICWAGNLTITSKSAEEPRATCAEFDLFGRIKQEKKVAHGKGTIVVVTDLFAKSPVRCKYLNALPQLVSNLKEVEQFLRAVSIINNQCHFTLVHNGNSIWTKPSTISIEQGLTSVWGHSVSKQLQKCKSVEETDIENERIVNKMELYVPRIPIDKAMLCSTNKMTLIYVNKKAVQIREFEKVLKERICSTAESSSAGTSSKYPVCVLNIEVPSQNVDFNRDLDKRKVFLVHKEKIAEKFNAMLQEVYSAAASKENQNQENIAVEIPPANVESAAAPTASMSKPFEEKQNNIMSFLNEMPVTEPLNFTRSPSKVPQDRLPMTNVNQAQANKTLHLISPKSSCPPTPALPLPSVGLKSPLADSNLIGSDIGIKDKDWIHGRMTDKEGNIIESTVLVRADPKPTLTDGGLRPSIQTAMSCITTPSSRSVYGNGISSFLQKAPSMEHSQSFGNKRRETNELRYENPPKRRRQSDSMSMPSQSQGSQSQGIGRHSRSEPRQVTLETLRNWPQPRNTFAKTNVVHSITQPSFPEPSRNQNSFENLSKHLQNARPPVAPAPKVSPSSTSVEPRRDSNLITTLSEREMLRSGTLGLRTQVPGTPQVFRPKIQLPHDPTANGANRSVDLSSGAPAVIGKLDSELPLFVVKINTMLGVLNPVNLLEMEPNLKHKLNLDVNDKDTTTSDLVLDLNQVHLLATEFSQLSYEDYEETQVKRVFSCLKDFGEE